MRVLGGCEYPFPRYVSSQKPPLRILRRTVSLEVHIATSRHFRGRRDGSVSGRNPRTRPGTPEEQVLLQVGSTRHPPVYFPDTQW